MKTRKVVRAAASLGIVAVLGFVIAVANVHGAAASPVVGDWQGAISAGGNTLHLAVHFTQSADGKFSGTMDSLDQNAMGIPMTAVTFAAPDVHFEIASISGVYDGKISKDNSEIAGSWKQAGQGLQLTLKRAAK